MVAATAKTGSLGVYLSAIGTVTPVYTDSINAEVTGVVTAVHYREGEHVRKGDPLIDIDPRPYAATLEQAQGALERDQNLLAEAQMDYKRYQIAWAKNAIPRQTLDDQEKLVLQDQGTVRNDQGLVAYDKVQLEFCHIVSPITGRVGLRLVDPGNLVTANSTTTLVMVTQIQPITVIFPISEDNLPQVLAHVGHGAPLSVEAWDRSNAHQLATGHLISIDNQIDTTTGTVKLRAQFTNPHEELYPNQFVNTRLLVTTLQNQTVVPTSTIQHDGDVAFVFVLKPGPGRPHPNGNGATGMAPGNARGRQAGSAVQGTGTPRAQYHVVLTDVKTGVSDRGMTAVTGIQPGDIVANSSFEKLIDGSDVYISHSIIPETQTSINGENSAP